MKGFTFDPARLHRPAWELERDGYAFAAELLREHLGGDPLAEVRRRARRDPVLREMLRAVAEDLEQAVLAIDERASGTGSS